MGISTRSWAPNLGFTGGLPPGTKGLLIANIGIFLIQFFTPSGSALAEFFTYCSLVPAAVVKLFFVWQLVTYMFLHVGISHILWNMLAVWMFGVELERLWGTRRYLQFYFFCGIGAGLCVVVGHYLFGNPAIPTVGASGAIYGLLLANAVLWPDRQVLFSFLIPMKMKYFVMIIGVIAFLSSFNTASPVSNVAHLGGMLFGYIFLQIPHKGRRPVVRVNLTASLKDAYRSWKLARAKRKFEVYMKKQKSDRGPWTN